MKTLHNFRYANILKRTNRALQIVLAITFIVGLNILAARYPVREDVSRTRLFALSPETLGYLRELDQQVKIIVTIPEDTAREEEQIFYDYVHDLLEEYRYESRRGGHFLIDVEYVDVFRELKRAREIKEEYGVEQPNLVLVASGDRQKFLTETDIMVLRDRTPVAFKGEQALTSALLEVASEDTPVVYFTLNHGEMNPGSVDPQRGLSMLAQELEARNLKLQPLDLATVEVVPEDAELVVVADPLGPFLPEETEKLRSYLGDRQGRLILLSSPGREHGLSRLLSDWGVIMDNMLIVEPGNNYIEGAGSMLVRRFTDIPITETLLENQTPVVAGLSRPARQDPSAPADERLTIATIMASSEESWAESSWRTGGTPTYNAATDLKGPVSLAVVARRGGVNQLGIKVAGGRVAAFGTADFISNQRISTIGNFVLMLNTINWMLERDQMLTIPPKAIQKTQLTLSRAERQKVGLSLLLPPLFVAAIGLIVSWVRRR